MLEQTDTHSTDTRTHHYMSENSFENLSRVAYLVELLGIDELEEFGHGVQLVGRPGPDGQCANFG
eukprot:3016656-Pyramimonas_sp.AAC.1